jgi:hypothetical protein
VTTTDGLKPTQLIHCETVYQAMREVAKEIREDEVPILVYEGFLTRLVQQVGLSVPYYSAIRGKLMAMGCIRQLRRGGGNSPSQWELVKPPTMALWDQMPDEETGRAGDPVDMAEVGKVKQHMLSLTDRVEALEDQIKFLVELYNEKIAKKKGA